MRSLSTSAKNLIGQPMFAFLAEVKKRERQGQKIIHFEIGDPHFETPARVVRAAKKSLDAGETHYTDSKGLWDLRQEVAQYAKREWGFSPSIGQILISPANAIVDFAVRTVANLGDEVLYPDPGFPTYRAVCSYAGVKGVPVPLREGNAFRMKMEDVRARITKRTRLIIINSPQNPTGAVLSPSDIRQLYRIAEKYDCYLLSDEVYRKLASRGVSSPSAFDQCLKRTIILYSFSKTYAMSGWRLGFALGPEKVIAKMGLMLETIISCLPVFIQRAGIAALQLPERVLKERREELSRRETVLVSGLNTLPGVRCRSPEGAFYVFANIKDTGLSSLAFRNYVLEKAGVAVLDGTAFGQEGEGFVRLSFASTPVSVIKKAVAQMREALKK